MDLEEMFSLVLDQKRSLVLIIWKYHQISLFVFHILNKYKLIVTFNWII